MNTVKLLWFVGWKIVTVGGVLSTTNVINSVLFKLPFVSLANTVMVCGPSARPLTFTLAAQFPEPLTAVTLNPVPVKLSKLNRTYWTDKLVSRTVTLNVSLPKKTV